jgi:hypothetical protein
MGKDPKDIARFNEEMVTYRADLEKYQKDRVAYLQARRQYEPWDVEYSKRKRQIERWKNFVLSGEVTQVTPDGLLVQRGQELIFLEDYPNADKVVDGDRLTTFAVRKGRQIYTTVLGASKTVPLYFVPRPVNPKTNVRPVEPFTVEDIGQ